MLFSMPDEREGALFAIAAMAWNALGTGTHVLRANANAEEQIRKYCEAKSLSPAETQEAFGFVSGILRGAAAAHVSTKVETED